MILLHVLIAAGPMFAYALIIAAGGDDDTYRLPFLITQGFSVAAEMTYLWLRLTDRRRR